MILHITSFKQPGLLFILFLWMVWPLYTIAQPADYPMITGKPTGPAIPCSPDPLVRYLWPQPKATDELERYERFPLNFSTRFEKHFMTNSYKKDRFIYVTGTGSLRFDFGQVNAGWLEFEADDMPDSITMSISEYNEPAVVNAGAVNPVKTKAPIKHGHTYRLELNPELYEGVRFGWLHVHKHKRNWQLKNLRLVCQAKPVNYRGSFSCSDQELTKIWYTGAYTVRLNLQKDYFGAILMERSDRHSWTGDAYPSQAAAMVAFGNYDFVKTNLINTSGLNNGIAAYSLYWVLSLIDYVNYTGDVAFADAYLDNAGNKLDLAYQHFGQSPSLGFYGWDERLGAGFENPNILESQYAYSMLSIATWSSFGRLMEQVGHPALSAKYKGYATIKMEEIRKSGKWPDQYGLHAAADAINTGLTRPEEAAALCTANFTDRINRLSYSPFNQYAVLKAMSCQGLYADALNMVSDYWGGQISQGATTFYEVYRPSWNAAIGKNGAPPNNQCGYTSLTHPWSAGVVKWLSEEVLGIRPLDPGFKIFEITPHTGQSLTWISGSTYTPKGLISASFHIPSGISKLTIPSGTVAGLVTIPIGKNKVKAVYVNNEMVKAKLNAEGYISLTDLKPGDYIVRIVYGKKIPLSPSKPEKWNYPIQKFRQDSLTKEKWQSNYGKDGYVLFNYVKVGEHLQKLPEYLSEPLVKNQANVGNTNGFGAIITQDPNPTAQTFTIDLPVKDDKEHQLALFFMDWDQQYRRSAVELFDLKSLNILAPVQIISNYSKGKFLIFKYRGSIRIRIDQLRGKNAALSGLFFDNIQQPL